MTNEQMSKYITGECRAEHERKAEICEDCMGDGIAFPDIDKFVPMEGTCPTCAPHRAKVKELCWHVPAQHSSECSKCGFVARDERGNKDFLHKFNPDLTTAMTGSRLTVVDIMDRAGLLIEFLNSVYIAPIHLLDGEQVCQAIESWLEGRG